MISAKEAKAITITKQNSKIDNQLNEIDRLIHDELDKEYPNTHISIDYVLKDEVDTVLKVEGYTVKYDVSNGVCVTISW